MKKALNIIELVLVAIMILVGITVMLLAGWMLVSSIAQMLRSMFNYGGNVPACNFWEVAIKLFG